LSRKEDLLSKVITELGTCQVRSGTECPCRRPAVVKIRGIAFCEPCAREQEVYFAIGELTEAHRRLNGSEPLVEMLHRMRHVGERRRAVVGRESDAA
jgi:hypothetical protein